MPLPNRVDPFGVIIRSPARGTFMGNRGGVLHSDEREIVRPFKSQRWITCLLEFKGRRRTVMSPRRYTELFFLDEAVAFAAGHRPCAECRRDRFNAFKDAWRNWVRGESTEAPRAAGIDAELHLARVGHRGVKATYQTELGTLPNGSMVAIDGAAYLVWDSALLLWTPERYTRMDRRPKELTVTVLTPRPIVECFRNGYEPDTHDSRRAL